MHEKLSYWLQAESLFINKNDKEFYIIFPWSSWDSIEKHAHHQNILTVNSVEEGP